MAEYALLTSAIAIVIVSALGGVGSSLPATATQTSAFVTKVARSAGVPPADARKAAARAPYARPSLRALWGVGWVAGRRDRATCVISSVIGGSTEPAARDALRRVPGIGAKLRRASLTEPAAVRAVDRGFRASCAG